MGSKIKNSADSALDLSSDSVSTSSVSSATAIATTDVSDFSENSARASGGAERSTGPSEARRRELADFLRTRRQKLQPEDLGIVAGSAQGRRRRTPGLRREEVAELAGVGTTWYTWLEQARDIQPSVEVLLRLAQALKLNHIETRHLFALSCKALPMDQDISKELVSESLLRLLQKSMVAPAVLLGARWDILATNSFAQTDFADMVHLPENRQNWVYYVFCILKGRERLRSWEAEARRVLAEFRSSVSETLDNPWILEVVDYMKKESPEFSQWWPEHDVRDNAPTQVNVHSAAATAPYAYERMVLRPFENLRYKILIFTPLLALS